MDKEKKIEAEEDVMKAAYHGAQGTCPWWGRVTAREWDRFKKGLAFLKIGIH